MISFKNNNATGSMCRYRKHQTFCEFLGELNCRVGDENIAWSFSVVFYQSARRCDVIRSNARVTRAIRECSCCVHDVIDFRAFVIESALDSIRADVRHGATQILRDCNLHLHARWRTRGICFERAPNAVKVTFPVVGAGRR